MGGWGDWKHEGGGLHKATRPILTNPLNGGNKCETNTQTKQDCVMGGWGEWKHKGDGLHEATLQIKTNPLNGGNKCVIKTREKQDCQYNESWGGCMGRDNNGTGRMRIRNITTNAFGGGKPCPPRGEIVLNACHAYCGRNKRWNSKQWKSGTKYGRCKEWKYIIGRSPY
jgi:hypothetical protein